MKNVEICTIPRKNAANQPKWEFRLVYNCRKTWYIKNTTLVYQEKGVCYISKKTSTLRDKAYQAIKNKILTCEIRPGEPLVERQLAAELGISKTPVREALKTLAHEGLVEIIPRRGAYVIEMPAKDLYDIYQVRQALECLAMELCLPKINQTEIEYLTELVDRSSMRWENFDFDVFLEMDELFHRFFIEKSGNQELVNTVMALDTKIARYRSFTAFMPGRIEASLKEHQDILEAIKTANHQEAISNLKIHLNNSLQAWQKANSLIEKMPFPNK